MRQAAVRSSFLHRLCKSALFLTLLPVSWRRSYTNTNTFYTWVYFRNSCAAVIIMQILILIYSYSFTLKEVTQLIGKVIKFHSIFTFH